MGTNVVCYVQHPIPAKDLRALLDGMDEYVVAVDDDENIVIRRP